jgi:hypothetical protein
MQTIPTQAKQSEEEQEMCGDYSEGGYCEREDDGMMEWVKNRSGGWSNEHQNLKEMRR